MNNEGKVLIALAAGLAAGSLLGLLLAPDTGEKSRGKLIKNAKKLNESLKQNIDDLSEKSQQYLKDVATTVKTATKEAEENSKKKLNSEA